MSMDICRWLSLLFCLTIWTSYTNSKEIRVVCYYTNWSVYRPGTAKFSPQNINPYLCTHLIYAFGGFTKENTLKPFDKYQDIEKGGYAKFTGLKTYNKNLKTMLAIGGWNEGSSRFSPMVANPERRKELIKNTIKFLRQNHFDGLDLDWEYPSFRDGGKSRDRDNYAQLVQELREEFERESDKTGRPRLLLTMAVPAGIEYINKGYDVPKLTKYLDWMNILSYDYHSAFEPAVNHHAPLFSLEEPSEYNYDTELNIDYTIKHYLEMGADPNKLVMGIPTYGRSYTLFNPDANEIGAPADGPGDMGDATRENGYLAYYEICENIKTQDWEVVQPNPDVMGPYAYKDNQWVGYDDDAIARKKAAYVAENGLGGIMFWSIDNDDFRGNCHGKPYPIIEAAKEALISAYGLTDENLVSPPAKTLKTKTRTRPQTSSKSSFDNKDESSDKKRISTSGGSRRRNRVKSKSNDSSSSNRPKIRRKESRRTTETPVYSSLELVTPSYTTPAPPSTPDQGGVFKCEDEGFYPHPKDCKKYFWCLSGPGELGIIAHQFTCPAGLYFNKAADSCDYTRNVLCNKKLSKTTTTTTTTTEATTSKTTSRVPPKITAATSRTTLFRTTTTEAYDDEYEYEDEEDFDDTRNSEEDPKVIKELLDLIKKAGGIEELEKQLKIHDDGSASVSHPDATTPSSISKSLVEKVLGKAARNNIGGKKNSYSFLNRNSRGPQNEGLSKSKEKEKHERGRPQYTTITRQRSQKATEDKDETNEDDDIRSTYVKKQPEYVNIRRGRVSSTTEEPEEDSRGKLNRNKILGEEYEDDEIFEEEKSSTRRTVTPQYVNIRRQRPSTTEETATSKYTIIRRGSTTESDVEDDVSETSKGKRRGTTTPTTEDVSSDGKKRGTTTPTSTESSAGRTDLKSKYKILRRGSTTESPAEENESPDNDNISQTKSRKRGTTLPSIEDVSRGKTKGTTIPSATEASTTESELKTKYKDIKRGSTTESSSTANEATTNAETSTEEGLQKYSTIPYTSSTIQSSDEATTDSDTENPITIIEQLLITTPESLSIKTTASLGTTKLLTDPPNIGSKLSDSTKNTDNGVYQTPASEKRTPLLLEPRPFSLSSTGGPTSSLKPVTESSTRITKVSESNYKLRVRQKLPNTQSDTVSTNIQTTERPTPIRTRVPSRYKTTPNSLDHQISRSTVNPLIRTKKRFSTTTELYNPDNYDEYDLNRTYRPSEIADLSSLTAVDFAAVKGLNRFGGTSRQRRPRPTLTTTTKPEETLKTNSRTLPFARKFLDGTTFGKNRRIISNKNDTALEDQINSSSDTTHKIREFTRAPSRFSTITSTTEPTRYTIRNRKIIRRLRPTPSSKSRVESDHEIFPLKKRLIRPTQAPPTEIENLIESASANPLLSRRFSRPISTTEKLHDKLASTTEALQKTKDVDEENETSDDVSVEEGENIKLSESNIRENSNVNNHNILGDDGKKVRRKILKRIRSKVDGKDNEKIPEEKTSTEPNIIIRTRKIIRKLKPTESPTSTTSIVDPIEISTQGRIRKIIRRLRPTTESLEITSSEVTTASSSSSSISTTEKTLFIRGRPFIRHENIDATDAEEEKEVVLTQNESKEPTSKLDNTDEEVTSENGNQKKFKPTAFKSKYKTITRVTTPQSETNDDTNEEQHEKEVIPHFKSNLERPKPKTFSRSTTAASENYSNSQRTIDRSKYSTINRGTTSPTPKYEATLPTSDESREDGHEETEQEDEEVNNPRTPKYPIHRPITDDDNNEDQEINNQGTPKYRIYRPTILNGDSSDEVDENDSTTEPLKQRIFRPTITVKDNDEDDEEELKRIRILKPSLSESSLKVDEQYSTNTSVLNPKLNVSPDKDDSEKENEEDNTTTPVEDENIELTLPSIEDINVEENESFKNSTAEENEDEQETTTTTTTVRNYVNPILNRQKNRPAFVRPRITTPNPLRTTPVSKPKYRSFSRSSTASPKINSPTIEKTEEVKNEETVRKFVPKNLNRSRYIPTERQNSTEATAFTESSVIATTDTNVTSTNTLKSTNNAEAIITTESTITVTTDTNVTNTVADILVNNTTTEVYEPIDSTTLENNDSSTQIIEITTLYLPNSSSTSEDYDNNEDNSTVTEMIDETTVRGDESTTTALKTTEKATTIYEINLTLEDLENDTATGKSNEKELMETTTLNDLISSTAINNDEVILNETTINFIESSTVDVDNTTTETTPTYQPKSTLRSISYRPKFNGPRRLTSDQNRDSTPVEKSSNRFNQRNRGQSTRLITPSLKSTTPSSSFRNRFSYKYSTTQRSAFEINDQDETEFEDEDYKEPEQDDDFKDETEEQIYTPRTSSSYTPRSQFNTKPKSRVSNRPSGYSFRKTTEAPKITEDLSGINTEAVKNRNKNLFSKKRKMNTPFAGNVANYSNDNEEKSTSTSTAETVTDSTILTTTLLPTEPVTKLTTQVFETTEYLTTLHHVFAETEVIADKSSTTTETTTAAMNDSSTNPSKVEKLIEVNRIVEVHEKNNTDVENDNKVIDKVGVINRVTVVKVVDGNPDPEENEINETTSESTSTTSPNNEKSEVTLKIDGAFVVPEIAIVKEVLQNTSEQSSDRHDRKYEIHGDGKIVYNSNKDSTLNEKGTAGVTDEISNINVITPRPYYSTEASTISLQGLFQTDTPQKLNNINVNLLKSPNEEELLEIGNSRYVDIRILKEGNDKSRKNIKDRTNILPIKLLNPEDYITMKAEVVEVTPKNNKEIIKIVPIKVEMSRKIIGPAAFDTKIEGGVPKVNLQVIQPDYK